MTDLLESIDQTIAGWEAQPEAWNPGDPLYDRPRGFLMGEQTIRPMMSVLDDWALVSDEMVGYTLLSGARCQPCEVSWTGPEACWVCGEERPRAGLGVTRVGATMVARWSPVSPEFMARVTSAHQFQEAMAALSEQMSQQPRRLCEPAPTRILARPCQEHA